MNKKRIGWGQCLTRLGILLVLLAAAVVTAPTQSEALTYGPVPCGGIRLYFSDPGHLYLVGALWRGPEGAPCWCARCQWGTLFTPYYEDDPDGGGCGGC